MTSSCRWWGWGPATTSSRWRIRTRASAGAALTTELNPREFYLAQQLVDGCSYKEIAAKLDVSCGRVNDLVRAIYGKLGIHGKAELEKLV